MVLHLISYLTGKFVYLRLPSPVTRLLIRGYVRFYTVDVGEAELPISSYRSLGEFFTRNLKAGIRPVDGALSSPVDGTLRECGGITDRALTLVKGREYRVEELIRASGAIDTLKDGSFFNFYLSPRDYHHIHAPVTGEIVGWEHIAGALWPVNSWALKRIGKLFAVNERVAVHIKSPFGMVVVVMVGALNVGSIRLTFDRLETNRNPLSSTSQSKEYTAPIPIKAGERIGTFAMGSAVVLLVESKAQLPTPGSLPKPVRFGESLSSSPCP